MDFNDRRPGETYEAVRQRLDSYDVKVRSHGRGEHSVHINGQPAGFLLKGEGDMGESGYFAHNEHGDFEAFGATKAQAARQLVSRHDVAQHGYRGQGFTNAHHDHNDGYPVMPQSSAYGTQLGRATPTLGGMPRGQAPTQPREPYRADPSLPGRKLRSVGLQTSRWR